ncbi:MAG TPA: hypothetical protein VFG42_09080 [Baekduia sp.]|uniref:hypothetical protein n=1 Tax=Baekduia sp. TaxID=2600305 RepID=UPI002D7677E8|nr:hypothetical protein [Baekduia sp.]HET6506929.1 hypothetical protein [Baekduia sp.]
MSPRVLRPHPARDLILDAMRRYGEPMSPAELARITGATLGSTAYHVQALLVAEVIESAGERPGVRGLPEHLYMLIADDPTPTHSVQRLLSLCGATMVSDPEGRYPIPSRLDDDARAELEALLDRLRLQVLQIAAASTARVRRWRG